MPKPTSAAERAPRESVRVVIVTMDTHLASAVERARVQLAREIPGLRLTLHAAAEWAAVPEALQECRDDIARADVVIATMLFMEEHFHPVLDALAARRDACDAMVCAMSAPEVMRLTRLGAFEMNGEPGGPMAFLKKLRGGGKGERAKQTAGARQMRMLRRLPQILRFIPGTAQDVRAYFLTLQYWLGGSDANVVGMVRLLVDRYASGPRAHLRGALPPAPPVEYPDVGLYHPRAKQRIVDRLAKLPKPPRGCRGTVGVLVLRSYVLAGNTAHYDGVIAALESRGLHVVPAFASGLDAREAVTKFYVQDGHATIDALVSLTGFSLVGGPAYNDARAAEELLANLDVPYVAAQPVEFQTLEEWDRSARGLMPVEATIMVAIPELDGATGPMVYGGRSSASGNARDMQVHGERAAMLAARVDRLIDLRKVERRERRLAVVLFNFPPNAGNAGTAAHLAVFESLHRTLGSLKRAGYQVELPPSPQALRERLVGGNAQALGQHGNVHARIPADDHVRREPWLAAIENQWGPAPGRQQSDGRSLFVIGERFGNVFVGLQPGMGYEGDPMRLLFEQGFAPTHAFSAFYRWIREDFDAHAVLHFGTHGALEFMPGKQAGLSAECWPDRLIGDLPNFYLYASNNPSEGTIAKRRSAATTISYLTPPIAHAGLYRGLLDLKASLERWRGLPPEAAGERAGLAVLIQSEAAAVELAEVEPAWAEHADARIAKLANEVLELEYTLIPHGLHVVGRAPTPAARADWLMAMAEAAFGEPVPRVAIDALMAQHPVDEVAALAGRPGDGEALERFRELGAADRLLADDHETPAIVHALDGGFIRPAPGGDLIRTPGVLPTGRNLHGFDPFRLPTPYAIADGARQAERLLARHVADGAPFPESIALVLWGTDNLKTEGGPIAQALALMGARPRFDNYGRLAGATLVPLDKLGRPRVDVVMTLSGIFRDLLPLQTRLLAEAAWLAASADEPVERNFVRKHALAYAAAQGCDLETAALRVFGNADGAYGANVNHLVESGRWDDEDQLAETYTRRKGYAYTRAGRPVQQTALLNRMLADVDLAYQNLDSVELGVTTIDTYFDTLGGISRAVKRARGGQAAPVYVSDQTRGEGTVRTLSEQVALETRTRMLNPKWYEGMLEHGYEGVRQIEAHVTNTMGWSATTGQVQPWVYRELAATFVLDPAMRERLAKLNPAASAKLANRLIEAHERGYWQPDPAMLEELRRGGEELEDRLEGIYDEVAA
ncbi:MAG: magnesium chelatase subunit H [Steroidobacteraceae bacterium]|nr:magnesium chelatase subunit H [Steroidobacteraceae bacterium]